MKFVKQTHQFKKDLKLVKKQGKNLDELFNVVEQLVKNAGLDKKYKPHTLSGNWKGYLECHIRPDWLLIYNIEDDAVLLYRTGSHSDLFKK